MSDMDIPSIYKSEAGRSALMAWYDTKQASLPMQIESEVVSNLIMLDYYVK